MKAFMRILLSAFFVTSLVFAGCTATEEGEEMMEEGEEMMEESMEEESMVEAEADADAEAEVDMEMEDEEA